ncbi:MAG: undecaprenyl-diphosphatase UppP [Ignavibacteriales bacterium CG_4_9_14_3_um_filter_34_10]|nr:MAG: undecaprenyl-diphosphatase UppP [Ignavibacteriales bacterium CG_4_9_14_3_um_filter_34_10]
MNFIEAIILGIIQGLTEFLPISSTAHLTLSGKFMGLISDKNPESWTAFMAVIQLGTMIAVLFYFRNDIIKILVDFISDNLIKRKSFNAQSNNSRLGWFIILGSIPVIVIGLAFKDLIEGAFTKNLYVISISLIVLAIILAIAEKFGKFLKDENQLAVVPSILIGIAQAFALIPGSSRSGTTITAGLFLGYKRDVAARFSFLLSIPAVLGSGLLEFYQSLQYLTSSELLNLIVGTVSAAVSGYFAIHFLITYLKKHSTFIFIYYRIIIGAVILILIFSNIIKP